MAKWIARSALETESMGSNPGHDEVVFFWAFFFLFFLLTSLSLTCAGIILDHKVTRSGRDKERKNISSQRHLCGERRNKNDVWEKTPFDYIVLISGILTKIVKLVA